jgi:hypothetical protein
MRVHARCVLLFSKANKILDLENNPSHNGCALDDPHAGRVGRQPASSAAHSLFHLR